MRIALAALTGALVSYAVPATAAAPDHTPARVEYQRTSTVSGWGGYDVGQSRPPASLAGRHVVAVSAGEDSSLALTSDGAVTGWGWNGDGQAIPPADLRSGATRVVGIDAGEYHSLAVLADGSVRAWGGRGDKDEGQADVPGALADGSTRVVDVAAGSEHSLALDDTGKVWGWGSRDLDQAEVPDVLTGQRVVDVAAYGAASLALLADGRVVGWGDDGTGTLDVPTGARFTRIEVGSEVALGLTPSGGIVAWGDAATPVPRALAAHAPFSAFAAGSRHALVVHRAPKTATRVSVSAPAKVRRGKPVTVTVRLSGVASGSVVVRDGSRRLGTVKVVRGSGRLVVRGLKPGRHRLVAAFAGSATASSATSPARVVTVTR